MSLDLTSEINAMISERNMSEEQVISLIQDMIRSAYKMPLSYLLSAIIAILISFLPFVICIIIGGMSKVWWSYFLLLLSFFIFRSGRGRRDSR